MKKSVVGCVVVIVLFLMIGAYCGIVSLTTLALWPKSIESAQCGKAIYTVQGSSISSYTCDKVKPVMRLKNGSEATMGLYVAYLDEGTVIVWDAGVINNETMSCSLAYNDLGIMLTDLDDHNGVWASGNNYTMVCEGSGITIIATLDITPHDEA